MKQITKSPMPPAKKSAPKKAPATDDFPKRYEPSEFEMSLYEKWEEEGKFKPTASKSRKRFYIPIPPPNVTGVLHLGHALTLTLQDIMIRYHRMKGDETLWVPGTDHAGIATQAKVEEQLLKQGKRREEIGREKFLQEIWEWKENSHKTITQQIRMMGSSVDWSKERFTLDDKNNDLVNDVFVDLYEKKIIYRGEYMVNFCPKTKTVISDAEVEYREEEGEMYEIIYFVSGSDKELVVATTRPETLLADQAIAVHPKDKRYKKLIGRKVILPIVNKEIPIVADEMVDMEFGTGVVKITPAHDPNDFEAAKRHDLQANYRVIDEYGVMMETAGILAGMNELDARDEVVTMLKAKGNLQDIKPHVHKVGYSERGKVRVQTIVSTQWFVDSKKMAKKVMAGWKKGDFEIVPDRFGKIFEDWMENMHEWCISRQLWWGHQIPAYYEKGTGRLLGVTKDPSKLIKKYGEENVYRDPDVLDTWFSSALWPFSILDWNFEKPGMLFKKFYPASVLETGHDILFFWVIRMLLMGYEYTDQTPFKTVYLHGLLLDEQGRKFSKSLGNGIDPIEVINEYSSDALRLSCVVGNTPGNNFRFGMNLVKNNQVFLNKLWNVARFVYMNVGKIKKTEQELHDTLEKSYSRLLEHEKWILSRLAETVKEVTDGMEEYRFSIMGEKLYKFTRDEFADYAIECFKLTKDESKHGKTVMSYCLLVLLKLWHPYIPFASEKLSELISGQGLIDSPWPNCKLPRDTKLESSMETVFDIIYQIRNIRGEKKVKPGENVDVSIFTNPKNREIIEQNAVIIQGLAKCKKVKFLKEKDALDEENFSYASAGEVDIYIDTSNFSNEDELTRLKKLVEEKEDYLRSLELKLTDSKFLSNAPEKVIRLTQEKKDITIGQLKKAQEQLEKIQK